MRSAISVRIDHASEWASSKRTRARRVCSEASIRSLLLKAPGGMPEGRGAGPKLARRGAGNRPTEAARLDRGDRVGELPPLLLHRDQLGGLEPGRMAKAAIEPIALQQHPAELQVVLRGRLVVEGLQPRDRVDQVRIGVAEAVQR